jgi:peroxiredoxin
VLGIIVYAVLQTKSHGASTHLTGTPLTTPSALKPAANQLKVGTQAPDFTLRDINGKTYSLASQRGHPVFLEFFAVWCPHCQHEAPIIQSLAQQNVKKGVRMWMILANPYGPDYDASYGQDTTPATKRDVLNFQSLYGETLPKLVDPNFHVVNEYGVSAYPGLYVIDKHGKIVYSSSGETPASTLQTAINRGLNS